MSGSTFGNRFRITTWGESHGAAIGAVIDGCPAGLPLEAEDIQAFLDRRKPGQSRFTTKRQESDQVEILSGTFEGRTTGTSISLLVRNQDQRSRDYGNIASVYRPGHADYTYTQKYGFRDYRGGGRSSGRETIGRVAGGAVASHILRELGVVLTTYAKAVGPVEVPEEEYRFEEIFQNKLYMPSTQRAAEASSYLEAMMKNLDSCGGVIECRVAGLPAGIGEPVFEKLDACLGKALLSIGAVKAVEFGDGIKAARLNGSQNNDAFFMENGTVKKKTNHAGGILGGMSDGDTLVMRASVKPTPSIAQPQQTVTENGEDTELVIHGRHDPIIVPRAVVVVESMAALTLVDLLLQNMGSRMEHLRKLYL
ncbi:chorismate synthase [Schaedlerella arabinosiphila]|uniref:Chorismate synthase n=1 Tax=Schaedlerella arabinosiphila TaxID=2044587 RepID=A0A9X5CBX3_9FIRM|nr:chorismate synthase [Schaedlerella arabinosiphila]KAI4443901.1 Chorismate synthase [Schaedlerella arabinosiphila]MCI9634700.1 chorismate synthase [Ruminococcus sp.]NDO71480.1 chorismate synthase [Schaedlerella arabinosiphila]